MKTEPDCMDADNQVTAVRDQAIVTPKIRVCSENLKATIDGVEYTWNGGFGAVLTSAERGVKKGEVRMIGNVIFYCRGTYLGLSRREVSWCPQQDIDAEWIRAFKAAVFSV